MNSLRAIRIILEDNYLDDLDMRVLLWLIFSAGENPTKAQLEAAFEMSEGESNPTLAALESATNRRPGLIRGLQPNWDVLRIDREKVIALGTVAPMVMMKQLRKAVAAAQLEAGWHSSDLVEFVRLLKKYPAQMQSFNSTTENFVKYCRNFPGATVSMQVFSKYIYALNKKADPTAGR